MNPETGLAATVQRLTGQVRQMWYAGDSRRLPLQRRYSHREQADNEAQLDHLIERLNREAKRRPSSLREQQAARERLLAAAIPACRTILDAGEEHLALLHDGGLAKAAGEFVREARAFDANLSPENIYQAARNAWAMFTLQLQLALPVQLTPSILGYSLIYPYSDNFLDDPKAGAPAKAAFGRRLGQRLAGQRLAPANDTEARIWHLVGLIEGQYPRNAHPGVFNSLQAIHRAQMRSVALLRRQAAPHDLDVLGITIEKGGASVLAHGYLVGGSPLGRHERFLFALGAFLQLLDDLQDLEVNLGEGLTTIFTQAVDHGPLDRLTNRTFLLGSAVQEMDAGFATPEADHLQELMARSTNLMLIEAASHIPQYYSLAYVKALQAHSPVRLSYLQRQRDRLPQPYGPVTALAETFFRSTAASS